MAVPGVYLVTYTNEAVSSMGFLLASAAANGWAPVVLGFGEKAWWPEGLGRKINALRLYVLQPTLHPSDIVIFADAYDVLIMNHEEEIRESFESLEKALNRSLIFNGDRACSPRMADICTDPEPPDIWQHPRTYLNSGAFVGRVSALRRLLRDPVSDIMPGGDQAFYHRQSRDDPTAIAVDTDCVLLCTVARDLASEGLRQLPNGTLVLHSGAKPGLVHFPGGGHWPRWKGGLPNSVIQDAFKTRYPKQFEVLFDRVEISVDLRGAHGHHGRLDQQRSLQIIRSGMCFLCKILQSDNAECRYVTWDNEMCQELRLCLPLLILLAGLLLWKRRCWSCWILLPRRSALKPSDRHSA